MYIVSVALNIPLKQVYNYTYTSLIPLGSRVIVQLQTKHVLGIVIYIIAHNPDKKHVGNAINFEDPNNLKSIVQVGHEVYNISKDLLDLLFFSADYYHYPLGQTIFTALPKKIKDSKLLEYKAKLFLSKCKSSGDSSGDNLKKILSLNGEQQSAVNAICVSRGQFKPFLLHGVTGSGKTEVYLTTIDFYLKLNYQVLVLIPEINLTPQLLQRFEQRFVDTEIFAINSSISEGNRCTAWLLAKTSEAKIVISTRVGIFTPFANLGLIIVDEEHDKSFKQNDHLRYNARDLAIWRAQYYKIPIVLGSATPAIESFHNMQQGKYQLLTLTARAVKSASLAKISLIDTDQHQLNDSGMSILAIKKIEECLSRHELCLVFINKRGYAPSLKCYCGWSPYCKNCTSKLVCHFNILKCHHCDYTQIIPAVCPECQLDYLYTIGYGTQKVEQFLSIAFPTAKILRIDRDTTNTKEAWDDIYKEVASNQVDILVGTQMLAKGHDFSNLTLVVVIDSDHMLYSGNFRTHEELFSTAVQIAGRSGRGSKAGEVLIHTAYPQHQLYQHILKQDYMLFAQQEMQERVSYGLPPSTYYAMLRMHALSKQKLLYLLNEVNKLFQQTANKLPKSITVTKAAPCMMLKVNKQYRGQLLIIAQKRAILHQYLHNIETKLARISHTIVIDVDPLEC